MPLRAVSYLCVSTNQQAERAGQCEGLSIPAQREACKRRAMELAALVVAELNARGLTTKPGPNTPSRALTIRSLHHLLHNPYYAGVVTFNEVEHARLGHERKTAATDLRDLERRTREALDLLQDTRGGCEQASEPIRKQFNRAPFARILTGAESSDIRVELNEPYSTFETDNVGANGIKQWQNRSD